MQTLKANLDMEYTRNRQMVERLEIGFCIIRGEKYQKKIMRMTLKKIIGYSVKYETFFSECPTVYLTDSEASMLHNDV